LRDGCILLHAAGMDIDAFEDKLAASAARVLGRIERELEAHGGLKADRRTLYRLGFSDRNGNLGEDGAAHPAAPVKFLARAPEFIHKDASYLPFFEGLKQVFEIGVGTGYLFAMLRNILKVEMWGVDVDLDKSTVFDEMRRELGIADRVFEHRVTRRVPLPIPPGTEAVTAFRATFHQGWSVADHEWFLADCREKLTGARRAILFFNSRPLNENPAVVALYRRIGEMPLAKNDAFFIVQL
jgi:hypothetical protein